MARGKERDIIERAVVVRGKTGESDWREGILGCDREQETKRWSGVNPRKIGRCNESQR